MLDDSREKPASNAEKNEHTYNTYYACPKKWGSVQGQLSTKIA
jgi:hypothetical protein